MKNLKIYLLLFAGILAAPFLKGQQAQLSKQLLDGGWNAHWIQDGSVSCRVYGVFHFRKTFEVKTKPKSFIIHVSADNRYRLFVNGNNIGSGPARSSLYNWNFETYDIASYLQEGKNTIAALVWNMAEFAPVAQISYETSFLLQGNTKAEQIINTNTSWKVLHDTAYTPCATKMGAELHTYMVVGPGDELNAAHYPWGWEKENYNDNAWKPAAINYTPVVMQGFGSDNKWTLFPRSIPQMEQKIQRMKYECTSEGNKSYSPFLEGKQPVNIPAHSTKSIIIDQGFETVGYPVLKINGGKNASVKITYAEALVDSNNHKGNRNETAGKKIKGLYDIIHADGGKEREFSPLWIRTWRYMQIDITTEDEPLQLQDLFGIFTAYPFKQVATFESNDSTLKKIWEVGWRTARLCAGETYFDCPYYEQLQYEGDTRIQSLISLYNTGDDRLMRKAIDDFFNSRVPEGLTQGRFPSDRLQVIPPFSLFWVSIVYDYWMHRDDAAFVKKYLDGAEIVLKWYAKHIDSSKQMLGPMPWWNFVDWNDQFPGGTPDGANDGNSSILTFQYVYTLKQAAQLFSYFGETEKAKYFSELAERLAKSTYEKCFDKNRMEMANTPEKKKFSQHAGIMAVLADAIPETQEKEVVEKVLYDTSLSQATFYYRFYLTRAMIKAGLGDLYYSQLTPWRDMLAKGLTTFAEKPDPTRSDCHAWSASPEYDFLATICGIMPSAPGFSKVKIEPHLGALTSVTGSIPVPSGTITVMMTRKLKKIQAKITLPQNVTGTFIWNGKETALRGGFQEINL